MSFKAKIEAVIYASEEPVTLAQLVGLLGHEAQRELDGMDARQENLPLTSDAEDGGADEGTAADHALADSAVVEEEDAAPEPADHVSASNAESVPVEGSGAGAIAEGVDAAKHADGAAKRVARDRERRLRAFVRGVVEALIADYATADRGLEVREVAGGYRMATKPEYHDAVRGFVKSLKPPLRLSLQALETLAVVAYKQPVTSPEISEIRGVDSGGVLGSLLGRKLITTAGRKQVIGRPILYKTTKDFLLRFGLKDVNELPSIEEFEKLAGELVEQEEIPMLQERDERSAEERITHEDMEEEKDVIEPQADGDSGDLDAKESDGLPAAEGGLPGARIADGRLAGLPAQGGELGNGPSAAEAAIQSKEGR